MNLVGLWFYFDQLCKISDPNFPPWVDSSVFEKKPPSAGFIMGQKQSSGSETFQEVSEDVPLGSSFQLQTSSFTDSHRFRERKDWRKFYWAMKLWAGTWNIFLSGVFLRIKEEKLLNLYLHLWFTEKKRKQREAAVSWHELLKIFLL